KGYVTFGETDFDRGYRAGKDAGNAFMFHLTIATDDIDRFIEDPRHTAPAKGWIESDAFGGRLPVTTGMFNLFVAGDTPALQRMTETTERVVEFTAGDGLACNVINVRGPHAPAKGPVLLVHGAGVRANIFRAPSSRNLVQLLVDEGWDVWLENWRASIDIPH